MKIVSIALASSLALFAACGNSVAPSHSKDQYSGSSFLYLDAADRQKIMSDVKEMVLDNYVLLKIKESRGIVANPTALFDNAVAAEAQRGDVAATDAFAQAESNLQFLDRVKMTIAAFHDTHFSTSALVPRSQVLNGLQVDRVGTDVRVTGLRTAVIDFVRTTAVDPTAYDHITVGLKVVSIDGTPVDDLVKGLQVYESASTTSSGDTWATQDLSLRNFQLPTKNYADWEFSDGTTTLKVRLPYFYLPTAKSGLAPTAPAAPRQ